MRLVTIVIALAAAIGSIVVPASAQAAEPAKVTATFAPESAGVVFPGQDLILRGAISNPTNTTIPAGTATVSIANSVVSSRTELAAWLKNDTLATGEKLGGQVLQVATPEVSAGRTVPLDLTVPAASLNLDSRWGVRTTAVSLFADGKEYAEGHTSIVWSPGGATPQTRLAIAAPLTVPASADGLIPADLLASYTAIGGLLDRELDEIALPGIAIGIDPRIIASIRILGDSAPASAITWLRRLAAVDNDTFALSYADYDIAGANQAGAKRLLNPTDFIVDPSLFRDATLAPTPPTDAPTGTPTPSPSPTGTVPPVPAVPDAAALLAWNYTIPGVVWPGADTVVESDLDLFSSNGLNTAIMSSGNVSFGDLDYTPSSAAKIGDEGALISDTGLSTLLRDAAGATTMLSWSKAVAELSSSVAVVGQERPTVPRTVLLTLGRSTPGSQFRLAQTLQSLFASSWATTAPLPDLTTEIAASPTMATLVPKPEAADHLALVTALLDSEALTGNFSSILLDPRFITVERRQTMLALLANSWANDPAWPSAVDKYLARSTKLMKSVSIAGSRSLVVWSTRLELPVTVRNDLDWPVSVVVTMRSPNSILIVNNDRVDVSVEAHSQTNARIPVQSIANGDITVDASLSSATNVAVGEPVRIRVDVQAQWETAFTAILALIVVLVFGGGIWRNIAKRRKAKRVSSQPDAAQEINQDPIEEPTP